ncbi:MAG: hypothetical protein WED04_00460 [Promethearchaeati archaeon SRVP18_Atabeyarchaeia-1]
MSGNEKEEETRSPGQAKKGKEMDEITKKLSEALARSLMKEYGTGIDLEAETTTSKAADGTSELEAKRKQRREKSKVGEE